VASPFHGHVVCPQKSAGGVGGKGDQEKHVDNLGWWENNPAI
jgi:hypothetical protein